MNMRSCMPRAGNVVGFAPLTGLAMALAIALAACSAAGTSGARSTTSVASSSSSCAGQPYVDVRNDLAVAVDVYGYVGGTPMYLGTVSTGVGRLPLLQSVGYIYAEYQGRRVSSRRRAASRVSFTRGCERA